MEQGIDQRKTNIDIIKLKHNIHKTLYTTGLKDTLQEKIKSEVKWIKDFQNYDIVWKLAYQMAHRCTIKKIEKVLKQVCNANYTKQ